MVRQGRIWLEHYPPAIAAELDYPDLMIPDLLRHAYEERPKKTAIRFLGKSLTYEALYESALRCAQGLKRLGVKEGDRVSIMLPNCPQYVISYYGVLLAGAIVVQTNPLYVERELEEQLNDASVQTIIALDLVYPKVMKVKDVTPLSNVIITSIKDYLPFPKNMLYPLVQRRRGMKVRVKYKKGVYAWTKWLENEQPNPLSCQGDAESVAILQYTGGTTGKPKGVMLTHRNLIVNVQQCRAWLEKAEYGQEKCLGIVPFFHVYGMTTVMNFSIYMASTMILLPRFSVTDTLKTIAKEKPTLFPGAPTLYIGLMKDPQVKVYDLKSIKACISGSAPLPVEVKEKFEALTEGKIVEGYGLSETSPVTHCNVIWGKNVTGSIGIPWPDTDATILDEDGEEVAPGTIGQIAIKGPQVMKGYWNRPDETARTFHHGWLLTGDLGYMDDEGFFYVVDRQKDMIISGGYKIYPREVEEVLYVHDAVQECCVIGVPDDYKGESVKAFIVPAHKHLPDAEELAHFCRQRLAVYKVPKQFEFRDELPKNIIGKVLKRVLREEERRRNDGA